MPTTELFNRRSVFLSIVVIAVLFTALLYYAFEDESQISGNPDPALVKDTSSMGKKAFVELLKIRGYQVDTKLMDQVSPEDYKSSLVIYFLSAGDSTQEVRNHFKLATATKGPLIIAPKFKLLPNAKKDIDTLPRRQIDSIINAVFDTNIAHTIRKPGSISWASEFSAQPDVIFPQLVVLDSLKPQIAHRDSIFYGSYKKNSAGGTLNLLADPDIASNYAVRRIANAKLILAIVNSLLPTKEKSIIISYNAGGSSGRTRNPLIALFHFPTIILLVFFLIMIAALIWMGTWKKLQYTDSPKNTNRKQQLISAFGNYFSYGKISNKRILQRYFQIKARQAAKRLAVPAGFDEKQQMDWLRKFCRLKGIGPDFDRIQQEVMSAPDNMTPGDLQRIGNAIFNITEKLVQNETRRSSFIS